ncbi:MAG: AAA family ATPase, partial [Spirochaetota bacterium]
MFLKSIELFGFKSFAERSRIEFEDGISALLGPNGCGKSNVVDAIKWVLGEQATKALRAERMEDVIFNGTENRKPLNVAEVTLVLSDTGRILTLDISEISVKRRLYRSGESEYFINNTAVKLKELKELFFDTGIGKSAYSIMEQGKIDQILSNKPEERRHIFEEAAGITKYKVKGAEAERKLEKTEENMRQVENILGEVKRSYDALKLQADKTIKYRELVNRMFELELDLQLLRLKDFLEEKHKKEQQLLEKSKNRDELKRKIDGINELLEKNLDVLNALESELIESQKKLYGLDLKKNNKESQIILLGERHKEIERQIEFSQARERALNEKIASLEGQIDDKRKLHEEFVVRIGEIEGNIKSFEQNIIHSDGRIKENEKEISTKEREIHELEKMQVRMQNELRMITDDIVTQLDQKLKETGYSYSERRTTEASIQNTLDSMKILINGKIRLMEDAFRLGQTGSSDLRKILESSIAALKDSFTGIEKLISLFESYSKAIPAFIDEFLSPEGIITRKREIDSKIEEILTGVSDRRHKGSQLRQDNKVLTEKIDAYRKTLEELRLNKVRVKTQQSG